MLWHGMEQVGPGHWDKAGEGGRVRIVARGAFLPVDRAGFLIPIAAGAPMGPGLPFAVYAALATGAEHGRLLKLEFRPVRGVQLVELIAIVAVVAVPVGKSSAVSHGKQALMRRRNDDVSRSEEHTSELQ